MFKLSENAQNFLKNNQGKKIVFTNGCFDILHSGHVTYLNEAKKQGDLLFLGLNSDASIKRLKGESRPINGEADRKYILENLRCVDCVEIFTEDTPYSLIDAVRPDVLVKGGDWKVTDIVGHDIVLENGGEVKSLIFVDGYSTTGIISSVQGKE
ncbi:bifunctional heptose 7-phosphate kinase/heptose 1-phosphate adenyltransferase [Halobacteriovorax marinus]|uniref:D-glycero-beta-D-manno-heptose 1-phosphate adenylyltransferase n=1 Tax=Halobacteriovorax marinus TaxID=97084 RepID=UPI000BC35C98|nr:D-glycero-beta-D-manno-heptose 1-phosphate adenylyltransferase [Halobacteriovorax marinus]ATH06455.1 bifunctional heptose 7-phosphate kinase/heptose 1-phosphate adenyltransferase [Halobacteriovorax marinus]